MAATLSANGAGGAGTVKGTDVRYLKFLMRTAEWYQRSAATRACAAHMITDSPSRRQLERESASDAGTAAAYQWLIMDYILHGTVQ